MSSEWPVVRLGDHVDACLGKMLDAKKNKGTPQPYLGNSNVRWGQFDLSDLAEMRFEPHEEDRYSLVPGDLVVCEGGEPGRCAIWTGPAGMKVQKALHRIRPKNSLNNYYLFYWFQQVAKTGALEPYFTGTTIKHLTGKAVSALEMPLPPIEVQCEVVDVLRQLDHRITLLRETNATLDAIAQALFKSWFVDFDPVRAKMAGRAPEGMDEATAALFPDSMEEAELVEIPKGWRCASVYEAATVIYGAAFASKLFKDAPPGIPLVRIRDLKDESPSVYTEERHPKGYLIQPGDVVVGMDGEFRAYLWGGESAWLNQRVCVFKPVGKVSSAFVRLSVAPLLAQVEASETATTVIHLGKNDIDRFRVTMPDDGVLQRFSELTNTMYERVVLNKQTMQRLARTRDTLLPRLISGQLRLPEAAAEALA